jgi:flagellar hook-length control protein FliK
MGTVRIQLQIQNGTVNAQVHAETESTRTMLNQQLSHLRTALENQGLSVERLGVQTMQNSSGSNLHNESQSGRDGQANDGRSRGGFTHQGNRQGQPSDTPEQQAFEQELTHAA